MANRYRSRVIVYGLLFGGLFSALVGGSYFNFIPYAPKEPLPAPHTLPRLEGGTGLRLAMVHDILHDRYLVHSEAYWEARLTIAKAQLDEEDALTKKWTEAPSQDILDAMDVYGVCLDYLHRAPEAVEVMRKKLEIFERFHKDVVKKSEAYKDFKYDDLDQALDEGVNLSEVELGYYRTLANLGTFIIHAHLKRAFSGDQSAEKDLTEGMGFIHRAVFVNPGAHFGRETWQLVAVQRLLEGLKDPKTRHSEDLCGGLMSEEPYSDYAIGLVEGRMSMGTDLTMLREFQSTEGFPLTAEDRQRIRRHIRRFASWDDQYFFQGEVPFDEPTLGLLGMWTLGGGPNPFFAVALANLMDIVGQKYIAWAGYERAARMAERFWNRKEDHEFLKKHCRRRQERIEKLVPETAEQLRAQFDEELAFGRTYQKEYKDFEEKKLKEGVAPNSKGFYDEFFKGRESIATEGFEDEIFVAKWAPTLAIMSYLPAFLFFFGLVALVTSLAKEKTKQKAIEDNA